MSMTLNAAFNEEADKEADLIKALRKAINGLPKGVNPRHATLTTQHYGQVDLLNNEVKPEDERVDPGTLKTPGAPAS